jgi:nitrate/TMAO reductase-like tetraheme cytochrome c subunit
MKKVILGLVAVFFLVLLSTGAMATVKIKKEVYGSAAKGCKDCHTAMPAKKDNIDAKQKDMVKCSEKTGKSCGDCHKGNPKPADKCPS